MERERREEKRGERGNGSKIAVGFLGIKLAFFFSKQDLCLGLKTFFAQNMSKHK